MEFDALRAAVVPGPAVVGRWPGIVCVAECTDRQVLRHLLEVCAAASGPEPGRALARRLTMWLGGQDAPGDGLRFGTVAVAGADGRSAAMRGEQWAVFLYGPVGLVVPDRQVALSGAQAVAWTDRLLPRPDVPVVLALEGGPIPPGVIDGVHDLRSGVVPGAGAVLVPGGSDGLSADGGEEQARRRPDEPLWAEPTDRERPRWAAAPAEPALAAPTDGLFRGPDGPGNGISSRSALEDLAPEVAPEHAEHMGADFGGDLGVDRGRLGERNRAHLRPVPSGSNGVGHRARGPRRAQTFDLGRFGGGPGRPRDAGGPPASDNGERRPGAPPGSEADETGPPGPDLRGPAADEGPTLHNEIPSPTADETPGGPGVGAAAADVNGTGRNDSVPSERSPLDVPFGELPRDEPVHHNGGALNGGALNGGVLDRGVLGNGLDGGANGTGAHDVAGHNGVAPDEHTGAGRNGTTRNGRGGPNGSAAPGDTWAAAEGTWPDRAEGHWFGTRGEGPGEPDPGAGAPDARRPRHGRQDGGTGPDPDEDGAATAGTPRFGVQTVPPAAELTAPASDATPPDTDPAPLRAEQILGAPADEQPRPPLPVGAAADVPEDAREESESQVRGHLCPRGHLNDPRLSECALCGSRIEDEGGQLVAGPRPALGLLVFDDGSTYTVDAEYLVGRMPEGDARVASGALRSLSVEDPSGAVSRVHAEVRVADWDVLLTDAGSRNGTFVSGPGEAEWSQLPEGQTHRLVPGTRVRLGGRSFLFESPSGAR